MVRLNRMADITQIDYPIFFVILLLYFNDYILYFNLKFFKHSPYNIPKF